MANNVQYLRHQSMRVDLASIALVKQLCYEISEESKRSTCNGKHLQCCIAIADDPMLRCPFTLLLTGGRASMLNYDGEGTTTLGAGMLIHTFYQMTGSLTKGTMRWPT